MKITFVLDTPNLATGTAAAGTPARIVYLAKALKNAGNDVTFVLGDRGMSHAAKASWPFQGLLVHPDLLYGEPSSLSLRLRALNPDVLVVVDTKTCAINGRAWANAVGARLIYEAHDDEAELARALGEPDDVVRARARWQAAAALIADFVNVLSDRERQTIHRYGVPLERIQVAPNGADLTGRTVWGPDPAQRRLLFIGNLFYEPNAQAVRTLIDVVETLRAQGVDVTLRVVGRGPAELTRSRPGIDFLGMVDQADLDGTLSGVSLAVAPVYGSGMKCKMFDYMAAGLPVLATTEATNGLPEGHPGVIVSDDFGEWPALVEHLLDDADRLLELGLVGRFALHQTHNWPRIAERVTERFCAWLALPVTHEVPVVLPEGAGEPQWLAEHAAKQALGEPHLTKTRLAVKLGPVSVTMPATARGANRKARALITRSYNCQSITAVVRGSSAAHDRIMRYFPLGEAASGSRTVRISLALSPRRLPRLTGELESNTSWHLAQGHPDLAYKAWCLDPGTTRYVASAGPSHVLTARSNAKQKLVSINVDGLDEETLGRTAVRMMRQLMLRNAEEAGGINAHGAAVVVGDGALVLFGRPGAGKTTVAFNLVANHGADLLGADRLVLVPSEGDAPWKVLGVPIPWRIASGTIGGVPVLKRAFDHNVQPYRGIAQVFGKHELLSDELAQIFGVGATLAERVARIVVLEQDLERPTGVTILDPREAEQALAATAFRPEDQLFVTDWFGLYSVPSQEKNAARARKLCQNADVYRATWQSHEDMPVVAALIKALEKGCDPE